MPGRESEIDAEIDGIYGRVMPLTESFAALVPMSESARRLARPTLYGGRTMTPGETSDMMRRRRETTFIGTVGSNIAQYNTIAAAYGATKGVDAAMDDAPDSGWIERRESFTREIVGRMEARGASPDELDVIQDAASLSANYRQFRKVAENRLRMLVDKRNIDNGTLLANIAGGVAAAATDPTMYATGGATTVAARAAGYVGRRLISRIGLEAAKGAAYSLAQESMRQIADATTPGDDQVSAEESLLNIAGNMVLDTGIYAAGAGIKATIRRGLSPMKSIVSSPQDAKVAGKSSGMVAAADGLPPVVADESRAVAMAMADRAAMRSMDDSSLADAALGNVDDIDPEAAAMEMAARAADGPPEVSFTPTEADVVATRKIDLSGVDADSLEGVVDGSAAFDIEGQPVTVAEAAAELRRREPRYREVYPVVRLEEPEPGKAVTEMLQDRNIQGKTVGRKWGDAVAAYLEHHASPFHQAEMLLETHLRAVDSNELLPDAVGLSPDELDTMTPVQRLAFSKRWPINEDGASWVRENHPDLYDRMAEYAHADADGRRAILRTAVLENWRYHDPAAVAIAWMDDIAQPASRSRRGRKKDAAAGFVVLSEQYVPSELPHGAKFTYDGHEVRVDGEGSEKVLILDYDDGEIILPAGAVPGMYADADSLDVGRAFLAMQSMVNEFGVSQEHARDMVHGLLGARAAAIGMSLDDWLANRIESMGPLRPGTAPGAHARIAHAPDAAAATMIREDGRVVLLALQKPDAMAMLHEIGHVLRADMTPDERAVANEVFGHSDGPWTVAEEERFAKSFERWVMEGETANQRLVPVFERLAAMLSRMYRWVTRYFDDVPINEEIRGFFDSLMAFRDDGPIGDVDPIGAGPRSVRGLVDDAAEAVDDVPATPSGSGIGSLPGDSSAVIAPGSVPQSIVRISDFDRDMARTVGIVASDMTDAVVSGVRDYMNGLEAPMTDGMGPGFAAEAMRGFEAARSFYAIMDGEVDRVLFHTPPSDGRIGTEGAIQPQLSNLAPGAPKPRMSSPPLESSISPDGRSAASSTPGDSGAPPISPLAMLGFNAGDGPGASPNLVPSSNDYAMVGGRAVNWYANTANIISRRLTASRLFYSRNQAARALMRRTMNPVVGPIVGVVRGSLPAVTTLESFGNMLRRNSAYALHRLEQEARFLFGDSSRRASGVREVLNDVLPVLGRGAKSQRLAEQSIGEVAELTRLYHAGEAADARFETSYQRMPQQVRDRIEFVAQRFGKSSKDIGAAADRVLAARFPKAVSLADASWQTTANSLHLFRAGRNADIEAMERVARIIADEPSTDGDYLRAVFGETIVPPMIVRAGMTASEMSRLAEIIQTQFNSNFLGHVGIDKARAVAEIVDADGKLAFRPEYREGVNRTNAVLRRVAARDTLAALEQELVVRDSRMGRTTPGEIAVGGGRTLSNFPVFGLARFWKKMDDDILAEIGKRLAKLTDFSNHVAGDIVASNPHLGSRPKKEMTAAIEWFSEAAGMSSDVTDNEVFGRDWWLGNFMHGVRAITLPGTSFATTFGDGTTMAFQLAAASIAPRMRSHAISAVRGLRASWRKLERSGDPAAMAALRRSMILIERSGAQLAKQFGEIEADVTGEAPSVMGTAGSVADRLSRGIKSVSNVVMAGTQSVTNRLRAVAHDYGMLAAFDIIPAIHDGLEAGRTTDEIVKGLGSDTRVAVQILERMSREDIAAVAKAIGTDGLFVDIDGVRVPRTWVDESGDGELRRAARRLGAMNADPTRRVGETSAETWDRLRGVVGAEVAMMRLSSAMSDFAENGLIATPSMATRFSTRHGAAVRVFSFLLSYPVALGTMVERNLRHASMGGGTQRLHAAGVLAGMIGAALAYDWAKAAAQGRLEERIDRINHDLPRYLIERLQWAGYFGVAGDRVIGAMATMFDHASRKRVASNPMDYAFEAIPASFSAATRMLHAGGLAAKLAYGAATGEAKLTEREFDALWAITAVPETLPLRAVGEALKAADAPGFKDTARPVREGVRNWLARRGLADKAMSDAARRRMRLQRLRNP